MRESDPPDAGLLEAPPWLAMLLPRFAWLAARFPWFAAPVAFHAWPLTGRVSVWSGAAIVIAIIGHAWSGGRAWQRLPATSGFASVSVGSGPDADAATALFRDEAPPANAVASQNTGLPDLTEGLAPSVLHLLQHASTPASSRDTRPDGERRSADDGDLAVRPIDWMAAPIDVLHATIAASERAEAALRDLRVRAAGLDRAGQGAVDRDIDTRPVPQDPGTHGDRPGEAAGMSGAVSQWSQWIEALAKQHDVAIDHFAVGERPGLRDGVEQDASSSVSGNPDRAEERTFHPSDMTAQRDLAADQRAGPVTDVPGDAAMTQWPHRLVRVVVRGAFEPLRAFIAALADAAPPVIVRAGEIMPDHASNGTRLQWHALMLFLEPGAPRTKGIAREGMNQGAEGKTGSMRGLGQRSGGTPDNASTDRVLPANPFRRRGQALTDIVVLATFVSGTERAALLARQTVRAMPWPATAQRSGAGPRHRDSVMETALVRPGETFADVRLISVAGNAVRLRPLLGGPDHVVRLIRQERVTR